MNRHREVIPDDLFKEYLNNGTVAQVFDHAVHGGKSREWALVQCIKGLLEVNKILLKDSEALGGVRTMLSVTNGMNYIPRLEILKKQAGL